RPVLPPVRIPALDQEAAPADHQEYGQPPDLYEDRTDREHAGERGDRHDRDQHRIGAGPEQSTGEGADDEGRQGRDEDAYPRGEPDGGADHRGVGGVRAAAGVRAYVRRGGPVSRAPVDVPGQWDRRHDHREPAGVPQRPTDLDLFAARRQREPRLGRGPPSPPLAPASRRHRAPVMSADLPDHHHRPGQPRRVGPWLRCATAGSVPPDLSYPSSGSGATTWVASWTWTVPGRWSTRRSNTESPCSIPPTSTETRTAPRRNCPA